MVRRVLVQRYEEVAGGVLEIPIETWAGRQAGALRDCEYYGCAGF